MMTSGQEMVWTFPFFIVIAFHGVCSNPGTEFILTLPQSNIDMKYLESSVYVTRAVSNDNVQDIQVSMVMKDPDEEVSVTLTNDLPGAVLAISNDRSFPVGITQGQKYLIRLIATNLVTVIVRNGVGRSNFDTYTAIPVAQLGQTYIALNFPGTDGTAGALVVIATASRSANIQLKLPAAYLNSLDIRYKNVTYFNNDVLGLTLGPYEACQLQFSNADLTGSYIESDEAIAVWNGVNQTSFNGKSTSHGIEQSPSINMTGKEFVISPPCGRNRSHLVRVVNYHLKTEVTVYTSSTNQKSYTLSRPGSVLDLNLALKAEMTFIIASRPVLVHWSNPSVDKESYDGFGDFFSMVIPPIDVEMPSSYTIQMDRGSHNPKFVVSFVIESGGLEDLTLNGQHLNDLSDFNLTVFDVAGRPGFKSGCLASENAPTDIYEFRQTNGVKFVATFEASKWYEGQGTPLSYGLEFTHQDYNDNKNSCCVTVNSDGLALYENECTDSATAYAATCCLVDFNQLSCIVDTMTNRCSLSTYTKLSSDQQVVHSKSIFDCLMSCTSNDACLGVNYHPSSPASTSCQLLFGKPLGYHENPATPYRYVNCVKEVVYAFN